MQSIQVHRTPFTAGLVTALQEYMYPLFVLYSAARLHFSAFHYLKALSVISKYKHIG